MAATAGFRGVVVNCEDLPEWKGSYFELYASRLRGPGEEWEEVSVVDGEELLASHMEADVVVFSGSHHDAYRDHPWVLSACDWIRRAVSAPGRRPRLIGVCFGHQLIGRALGGVVGRNKGDKMYLRVAEITPLPELASLPFAEGILSARDDGSAICVKTSDFPCLVNGLENKYAEAHHRDLKAVKGEVTPFFRLVKCHGDAVLELPPGAVNLARSEGVDHEMFMVPGPEGDVRALCVQGHPEFVPREVTEKIACVELPRLPVDEVEAFRETMTTQCHDWAVLEILRRFAKSA
jgi:GMP synthase-like glutamine amidotransferase